MALWKLASHVQKKETEPFLTPYTKINSRWIKDLITRPNTIKALEENLGKTIQEIGIGKDFMTKTTKALPTKAKNRQMGSNQTPQLLYSKRNNHYNELATNKWEKNFAIYPSDKGLISRIYKELKQIYKKK